VRIGGLIPLPQNPLGFDAADFLALGLGAVSVALLLARVPIAALARKLAERTALCMLLLALLSILLRLAMLPHDPAPTPRVADDFSYLLLGDTLAHFRLANPVHPMHRFFEAVFVLHEPSYGSIYPAGQGFALAVGQLVLRNPWAGVLLSVGALCAVCYWMLRSWVAPVWALTGGLLAAIEFGPLSTWMNTYWGGAVSGIAGCLVFGALPRLRIQYRTRDAVLLGAGLGLQLLTRPFEFVLLLAIVLLFIPPRRSLITAALVLFPTIGLTLLQNKQVTGAWTTLPYQLSRSQYGVPATFTFQPNAAPQRSLTVEQQIDYDAQVAVHGPGTDTLTSYLKRLIERIRFYRFFFLPPLYLALPAFLPALRERRFAKIALALALFWIGDNFYPYFYPHYIAAATCLFVLVSVVAVEQLSRFNKEAAPLILLLCLAHFLYFYGTRFSQQVSDPEGRAAINQRLAESAGQQLVFVRYYPQHGANEWIQNAADIDRSRVVWAIDLGAKEDDALRRYYPSRQAWLLEPDAHPPKLTPWR
jgi:hypothetical protein